MTRALERTVINSDPAELDRLFAFVTGFCRRNGVSDATMGRLLLVTEELVVNTIEHGYGGRRDGQIAISLFRDDGPVEMTLKDDAIPFDPFLGTGMPDLDLPLNERPIGGLGLFLVLRSVDSAEYHNRDNCNFIHVAIGPGD